MSDLRALWHVAANDLRLILRDRTALFWSFVGPFLFITFMGLVMNDDQGARQIELHVENLDASRVVATATTILLQEQGLIVRPGPGPDDSFTVIIPAGATDSLAAGRVPRLVLRSPEENPTSGEQARLASTFRALLGTLLGLSATDAAAELDSLQIRERVICAQTVRFVDRDAQVHLTTGFQRYLPSYLVMFVLMNAMTGGAALLIMERHSGQLRRTLVSSIAPRNVVAGKIVSRLVWSAAQILVMVLAGIFLYRISFGVHAFALAAVLLAFALCASAMGILFGTLFKNVDKAAGVGSIVVLVLAPLSGLWWPLEYSPAWMRALADYLPTAWAFDALNRIMAFDVGLGAVQRHLLLLLVASALCLPPAIRRIPRPD